MASYETSAELRRAVEAAETVADAKLAKLGKLSASARSFFSTRAPSLKQENTSGASQQSLTAARMTALSLLSQATAL